MICLDSLLIEYFPTGIWYYSYRHPSFGGKLHIGEEVQVFPGNRVGRIRSLQVHEQDTDTAYAGQRVAINIAGLKKDQIDRGGDVVAPVDSMKETSMLDVKLKLIKT